MTYRLRSGIQTGSISTDSGTIAIEDGLVTVEDKATALRLLARYAHLEWAPDIAEDESSSDDIASSDDGGYTHAELSTFEYSRLRELAANADHPDIDGNSARQAIIMALATDE